MRYVARTSATPPAFLEGEMRAWIAEHLFDGAVIGADDTLIPSLATVFSTVTVNGYLGTAVGVSYEPGFLASVRLVVDGSLHVMMASIEQVSSFLKTENIEKRIEMMGELIAEKMKSLPTQMLFKSIVSN